MGWAELRDEFKGSEPSVTRYVETVVRAAIVRGVAVGGESIRQEHVATRLEVSRTPIREAFQRLERQGLLRLVPNRGAVVVEMSPDDAEQIFLMRSILEPFALDRAFDLLSHRDLGEAEDFIVESESATDLQRVAELNWDFHSTLYKPASQQLVVATLKTLHLSAGRYEFLGRSVLSRPEQSVAEHRLLLAACRAGDRTHALDLLTSHINQAAAGLVQLMKETGH